ncbi:cell adhesion molecule Dscam2-like isoform X2 [Ornithodoros turicata]|uniref:cell adhesion molecule Dscam2-like isoform X2 n=1 Tax=Ornithodoros turicata TaxID=34597 RepID=UPI00313899FF
MTAKRQRGQSRSEYHFPQRRVLLVMSSAASLCPPETHQFEMVYQGRRSTKDIHPGHGDNAVTGKPWKVRSHKRAAPASQCNENYSHINRTWTSECVNFYIATTGVCLCLIRTTDEGNSDKRRTRRSSTDSLRNELGKVGSLLLSNEGEPFPPVISNSRRVRDVISVTALKGNVVTLVCPMYVAAWASIIWEKGENRLPYNHRQRVQSDGSLAITSVQHGSDDGEYICMFTDSRNQKHTGKVVLKVSEPPVISHYEFRQDMRVGMRIKVFCTVVQGDPPFGFSWLKDGAVVDGNLARILSLSVQNLRDYSMLSTDSLRLEHSGNYTCIVKNQAASTSYSAVLHVNEPPKWHVEPQNAAVIQGKNAQLQCSATGTPHPTITWMIASDPTREEFLPLYNSHKYGLFPNGTLSIQQVEAGESGYYLCKAANGFGEDLSKLVFLTVRRPPKFDVKFRAHAVKRGEKARLQCSAQGDLPISVSWTKNNERISEANKYRISTQSNSTMSFTSSTLSILTEAVEDSGIYSCYAKNHYGTDETSMRLLVQEVPGSPVNLTVINATASSLTLTWEEPFRGNSAITRFLIQYREAGTDDTSALRNLTVNSSQALSALITDLRPARVFSLRVKAENGVGWGPFGGWVTANTEEDVPSSPPVNITARPTGPNSIKISWEPSKEEDWNGHLKGYYISYRPLGSTGEQYYHKTVDVHNPHQRQEIHLTNLRLSMSYSVAIQAFTRKGAGPKSDEVVVKTLDDVPPSPPTLEVVSVTSDSVTLGWSLKTSFGNPVTEYVLHQRKDMEPWHETAISTAEPTYTVRDLECGTTYQFFMTAHNSLGRSEPSDIIRAKTDGAAPLSPSKEEFVHPSQHHATLNLLSWKSGGCELLEFSVRIRQGNTHAWTTLADSIPTNQSQFMLKNLAPGTLYIIHVVAKSTAGATEAQYEFATSNGTSHVASVEATSSHPKRSTLPGVTDLEILIPILVSSFVVVVVIIVGFVLCSRESMCAANRRDCGQQDYPNNYSEEIVAMKDLANAAECVNSCEENIHRSVSQGGQTYPTSQSIYGQRPEIDDGRHPYAMPYDVLHSHNAQDTGREDRVDRGTLKRRGDDKIPRSNIYISRQSLTHQKQRERPYESLTVNINPYRSDAATSSSPSTKDNDELDA